MGAGRDDRRRLEAMLGSGEDPADVFPAERR
jgi:hypothetical protein